MSLKVQLDSALKDAMRAGDDLRKRTVRMVLSAIRLAEVEKGGSLEDPAILSIIQKEIKARHESIADAERAKRADLVAASQAEIAVLEEYLPKQLSQDELRALARQVIEEVGATSPREMGQVMKVLVPRVAGRAPGDQVSLVVRQLLQQ
jgi:hypothetical protein